VAPDRVARRIARRMIYLDYQATTPLAAEAAEAMHPWIDRFANPHSPSRSGREAAAAIEVARGQVQRAIGQGGGVAFTGGATEAINWALKGVAEQAPAGRNRIVTAATEHAAVLDTCEWLERRGFEVVRLPVQSDGLLDLDVARAAIDERALIIAVMLVNNEIGVIQPIAELARLASDAGALMLCDAVQGLGRVDIPDGPDLIAVSGHKIHGPKGIGALWIRDGVTPPEPLIHGGGQEQGLRSGTLSPALCVGFGAAATLASERRDEDARHVQRLWAAALDALGPGWAVNGSVQHRNRGNLNIRRQGLDAARLLSDLRDLAFSLGSACASGSGRPSHVLRAIGLSDSEARSSIRLGFGRYTSEEELTDACRRIDAAARAQQGLAA
jgi:cysteine desulfurase